MFPMIFPMKILKMFKTLISTNISKKNIDTIIKFLKDNYTTDDIKSYLDSLLKRYKPGNIYNGVRVSNYVINYFLETLEIYPLIKGIIINKKYINDLIPFFDKEIDDFKYDKDTLLVDKDYTKDMINVFKEMNNDINIQYYNNDDIFILATSDNNVIKNMEKSFDGLEIQSIPIHVFDWVYK